VTSALYDSVARIARHESRARAVASVGKVTDVMVPSGSPPDLAVAVKLRDSGLVLPRVPVAVGALGLAAPPDVDDLVVVVFLEGDVNAPIVVGRLYHPDENPPPDADRGKIALELPSREDEKKLKLIVDGTAPLLTLELPDDVAVSIDHEKVEVKAAEMHLTVETSGGGRAEVAAGGSKITLKKDGDVSIKAQGNLKLEASEIEISGQSKVKVSGGTVEIN
jgi:uncharacterized protein involved in type VI secretion and phage assembly